MNEIIFFSVYKLSHQSDFFDSLIVFLAVDLLYIVIALAFLFLFFHYRINPLRNPVRVALDHFQKFVVLCVSGVSAYILAKALKILFHTPRPFDAFSQVVPLISETGYAFPSGHTMVASAVAFALFFVHKKAGYFFMFLALIIGLSRIIAGVHFPIDILGGFIFGAMLSCLIAYFVKKL